MQQLFKPVGESTLTKKLTELKCFTSRILAMDVIFVCIFFWPYCLSIQQKRIENFAKDHQTKNEKITAVYPWRKFKFKSFGANIKVSSNNFFKKQKIIIQPLPFCLQITRKRSHVKKKQTKNLKPQKHLGEPDSNFSISNDMWLPRNNSLLTYLKKVAFYLTSV